MLELRFAGLPRIIGRALAPLRPANSDGPPPGEPVAVAMLPDMPVSGINWTRHRRPWRPLRLIARRTHLWVVK